MPHWSGIGAGEGKRSAVNQLSVSACLAGVREAAHDYTTTALQVVDSLNFIACPKWVDLGERTLLCGAHCSYLEEYFTMN